MAASRIHPVSAHSLFTRPSLALYTLLRGRDFLTYSLGLPPVLDMVYSLQVVNFREVLGPPHSFDCFPHSSRPFPPLLLTPVFGPFFFLNSMAFPDASALPDLFFRW